MTNTKEMVHFNLDLSPELNETLEEREQKRASFWVKDIGVFLLALLLVLLIDFYAFTILLQDSASEGKIRFAIAALSSTISSLLSYLVGRASK